MDEVGETCCHSMFLVPCVCVQPLKESEPKQKLESFQEDQRHKTQLPALRSSKSYESLCYGYDDASGHCHES